MGLIPVIVSSSNAAVSPAGPAPIMIARPWCPEVMSYQIVPDWESNPVVSLVPWFRAWERVYRARTILAPVHGAPDSRRSVVGQEVRRRQCRGGLRRRPGSRRLRLDRK